MHNNTINTKNTYHPFIKLLEQLNALPQHIRRIIPRSTLNDFRSYDLSRVFGMEFISQIKDEYELFKEFANSRNLQKIMKAYIIVKKILIKLFVSIPKKYSIHVKEKIVKTIERYRNSIPFEKLLKYFNLTVKKYSTMINELKYRCLDSAFARCFKTHSHQLTKKEQGIIKEKLYDSFFKNWPISSIASYCLIHGKLAACKGTWYKYAKVFGIEARNRFKKKEIKPGLRATVVHQYWHADITQFKTLDNITSYIYIVEDNCSRYILSWDVSLEKNAKLRLNTIKQALNEFILPKIRNGKGREVNLIVDDGSENNNTIMDTFCNSLENPVKKLVALKQIRFSNSMVEAVNKIIKYRFLYNVSLPDFNALKKYLEEVIPLYNNVMPHGALGGIPPVDVLNGESIDKYNVKEKLENARKLRIIENRKTTCGICD